MLGAFRWDARFVVAAGLGVILSAVYMLWMFQRVYYGPITHDENAALPDLRPREWSAVVPLAAAALVMGIFPTIFLKPTGPAVEKIVQKVQASQSLRVENSVGQRSNVKGQK
jgi:NADH-quinone oxidoreductase subunit M